MTQALPSHPLPSGSGVGSKHQELRSPTPAAEWSPDYEEQDRIAAGRYFINAASDSALRMAFGQMCVPTVCWDCDSTFLSIGADRCHVCMGGKK